MRNYPAGVADSDLPDNSESDREYREWLESVWEGVPAEICMLHNNFAHIAALIDGIIEGYGEDIEFNQPYEAAEAVIEWYSGWLEEDE